MSPWCAMLTPQPGSLFAGERHHRSWKNVEDDVPVSSSVQVGCGVEKICFVIGFICVTPFTVYSKVPLFTSAKVKVPVPTWVTATAPHGTELKAGPVVR